MSYKIVVDSCCDLPQEYRKDKCFSVVPLTIKVDDYEIVDDESFDQAELIKKMKESPNAPKTSCPSPEAYMQAYNTDEEDIYGTTLSSQLSGSYSSAVLGKKMFEEEIGSKNIEMFDSCSASAGEVLIALKIKEIADMGKSFEEVVKIVSKFRDEMRTLFVLESLDNLRKNGRLSNIKAVIASVLNIKPIMGSTDDGQIIKVDQVRGIKKALMRMIDIVAQEGKDFSEKDLAIAHCNCYDRAMEVKKYVEEKCNFRNILIVATRGISTVYANDGGIVIAY